MKRLLTPLMMTWGMFSSIPCPWKLWDDSRRGQMLLWLPVLGLIHGLVWWGVAALLRLGDFGLLGAAAVCATPWLLSGGIHLDGYMDCCDAIFSRRELSERRRILKDSHTGAFAIIGMCVLSVFQFAAAASVGREQNLLPLIDVPAAVRCCSPLAINYLPPLPASGYSGRGAAAKNPVHGAVVGAQLLAAVIAPALLWGWAGLAPAAAALSCGAVIFWASRDLQGMSGDISGCAISVGELVGLAVLALC